MAQNQNKSAKNKKGKRKEKVKLTKIKEGMIIKNYKVFCDLVGEKVKAGEAKQVQIKRWSRFIEFERVPHTQAYRIIKIYDKPAAKQDKRMDRKFRGGIYKRYVEYLLMQMLIHSENDTVRTSRKHFMSLIGLLPPTWNDIINNANCKVKEWKEENKEGEVQEKQEAADEAMEIINQTIKDVEEKYGIKYTVNVDVAQEKDNGQNGYYKIIQDSFIRWIKDNGTAEEVEFIEKIPFYNIRTFVDRVNDKARAIFSSAIDSMEQNGLVRVANSYNVEKKNAKGYIRVYTADKYCDSNGKEYDENEIIRSAINDALRQLGCKNYSHARLQHKLQEAYEMAAIDLTEQYGILKAYNQTRLTIKNDGFDITEILEGDPNLAEIIKNLNTEFIAGLHRQTVRQHTRVLDNNMGGYKPMDKKYERERAEDCYVDNQTFLIDHFLNITDEEAEQLADEILRGVNVYIPDNEQSEEEERKQYQMYQEFYNYYYGDKNCAPKQNSENEDEYNDGN